MLMSWESEQRLRGNIAAAEMARVLREQYGDLPLPGTDHTNSESNLQIAQIAQFSDESKKALIKQDYRIYPLTGQSIRSLREAGRPFWLTWHQNYSDLENLPSRLSEVAINPNPQEFFLPKSNKKTLDQQLELVEDYSRKLTAEISGVKAILGEAPDYIELAFSHLDQTGDRLFGEKYGYNYTRTITRVESHSVDVGGFDAGDGLDIHHWYPDYVDGRLWVAPLVVPVENK